jgi:2-polyprenyl-3-methyl-5-hydroxy-6-metoxy-1,4-benzoquinol methylase
MDQKEKVAEAWTSYHRKEAQQGVDSAVPAMASLRVYQKTMIEECSREINRRSAEKPVKLWSAGAGIDIISITLKKLFKDRLSVTVFDISPECIDRNRQMFSRSGVDAEFVIGDIFKANYETKFDIVMNTGLLEHFDHQEQEALLRTFSRSLVKGGVYVTVTPFAGARLYRFCKERSISKKSWPYGPENAVTSMREFSTQGFSLREERQVGATDQFLMLKHAFPRVRGALGYLAEVAESTSLFLDPLLKPVIGGYAVLDIFEKE